ncbi:hypothetical protein BDF21DRAFT_403970 [Thamnidium elegans]|nr:hypothetical protein BDF21DRAFT_403970 [Thamnidium elegans]
MLTTVKKPTFEPETWYRHPANSYAVTSNEIIILYESEIWVLKRRLHSKSLNIRVTAKSLVFLIVQHCEHVSILYESVIKMKIVQDYVYYRFFEALILMGVAVTTGSVNLQIRKDEKSRKNK